MIFSVFIMKTKTRPQRHTYHNIEIPRPKNHDIEIPRPKSHDIEIPRPKNHDIDKRRQNGDQKIRAGLHETRSELKPV